MPVPVALPDDILIAPYGGTGMSEWPICVQFLQAPSPALDANKLGEKVYKRVRKNCSLGNSWHHPYSFVES